MKLFFGCALAPADLKARRLFIQPVRSDELSTATPAVIEERVHEDDT